MQEVEYPPTAAALMESTRSIGYSFDSAVADIIDNSISANAENVWVLSPPDDDPYVCILDDGHGMGLDRLCEAMRYGTSPSEVRDKNDLGRFGLGMKMASLSQCRCLTVVSKTESGVAACRWDLDRVLTTDRWTLQILSEDEWKGMRGIRGLDTLRTGTAVIWEKLDRIKGRSDNVQEMMAEVIVACHNHLAMVFHRFLDPNYGGGLKIFFNGLEIQPLDPFLSRNPKVSILPKQPVMINGEEVMVSPYVLPSPSSLSDEDIRLMGGLQRNLQGFWVYRNKRLIVPGTWFRLTGSKELTKLARVMVDIPNTLDDVWEIDVKKSSASVPVPFRKDFESVLQTILEKSEKKVRYRGRKASDKSKVFCWDKIVKDGTATYVINRNHPLIEKCAESLDEESKTWFSRVLDTIEESVPYNDIYISMSDTKVRPGNKTKSEEDVLSDGLLLIDQGVPVDLLKRTEPYMDYPKVLQRLEEYGRSKMQ